MKFNKSVYLPLFAACLSGLASCSDDDDFTWSEPVPSDCMDVYFADSNPTTYDVMSDEIDNLSFTVEVMRLNSAEAATVPLTVFSRSEAFECPSTIEFAAGENKAALEVKVNKVSSGDYTLELSIGDVRYSNPYVTYDGGWSGAPDRPFVFVPWGGAKRGIGAKNEKKRIFLRRMLAESKKMVTFAPR